MERPLHETVTTICPACFAEAQVACVTRSLPKIVRCAECDASFVIVPDLADGVQVLADIIWPPRQPKAASHQHRT